MVSSSWSHCRRIFTSVLAADWPSPKQYMKMLRNLLGSDETYLRAHRQPALYRKFLFHFFMESAKSGPISAQHRGLHQFSISRRYCIIQTMNLMQTPFHGATFFFGRLLLNFTAHPCDDQSLSWI